MPDLYIGKTFNPADSSLGERFLLKSSDLTTHGIVIGMTGSGKTGLSVGVIEELLRARVPVIVIDPKGDMGNLALAFDRLAPEQFEPWVDKDEAARTGKAVTDVAAGAAATWSKGLGDWGLSASDVASYASGRRIRVFTPGATAGIPLNLIDSLAAPPEPFEENEEENRDEIDAIVTALLGFVKVEADPVSSREYILLFNLIENAWRKRQDLDLETLIGQVANPPIEKVGALPLDSFYPAKDRNGLMMQLNNLVASPPFQVWRKGEPIDIESWVRGGDKPQLSIVYTAHLEDDQRVFITALILNKLKSWMRKQPGTSELRCLFYMDEIFGYFPPNGNPPTKKPLLTLLKQARAYGLGVLLSTQNPVDLDYKGLGNMGFWAIGRLQTEQDQARVKEGIQAALESAGPGGLDFDELIGGVQKRVFIVHDIHRKKPELVHSRWAMSYLRGPITRDEIRALGPDVVATSAPQPAASAPAAATSTPAPSGPPPLPAPLKAKFCSLRGGNLADPYVYVKAAVRYRAGGVTSDEETRQLGFRLGSDLGVGELLEQDALDLDEGSFESDAPADVSYGDLPGFMAKDGAKAIERVLRDRLDDNFETELLYDPISKKFGTKGESPEAFAVRIAASTGSDIKQDAVRAKIDKLKNDLRIKQQEASGRKMEKWASIGTAILGNIGFLTGKSKRVKTGGIGGVLSKSRMESTAAGRKEAIEDQIKELESQLAEMGTPDPARFERRVIKPTKTDVSLIRYDIVWVY